MYLDNLKEIKGKTLNKFEITKLRMANAVDALKIITPVRAMKVITCVSIVALCVITRSQCAGIGHPKLDADTEKNRRAEASKRINERKQKINELSQK